MKLNIIFITLVLPLICHSQTIQIGDDINGEAAADESGTSVSINAVGNIVAIGAPGNQGNGFKSGHVRVYQNVEGVWVQVGADIEGETPFDTLGTSVSLNANGTVVASGAPFKQINGVQTGHVPIFRNVGGSWVQIGVPIVGEAPGDFFGGSVALNETGDIVAIGAYLNDGAANDAGHVRVFINNNDTWEQIGADMEGEVASDNFGWSLDLSADGTVVAVGAPANDLNGADSGAVRIFENIGGIWQQVGNVIVGEGPGDSSGWSVSLNSNGTIVAIGAPFNDGNGTAAGHVRIFENQNGNWTQLGNSIDGEAAGDSSGGSVSLNANGTIIAIGAQGNDTNGTSAGRVVVYEFDGQDWNQVADAINGNAQNDFLGVVAMDESGIRVAIGAPFNDFNGQTAGQARIFEVTEVLGINNNTSNAITLFPSPTAGVVTIQSTIELQKVLVYNVLGQEVLSTLNSKSIDLSNHRAGLYFLSLIDSNGNIYQRKVIKN